MLESIENIKNNVTEIPLDSKFYPSEWKSLSDAPKCLYAIGNVALLQERKFACVGSRRTPANALKLGEKIAQELARTFVIVTGTADGGDTSAIEGGLKNGRIICLLAGGFSAIPQGNLPLLERVSKKGLLLSPHPFETSVRGYSYEYRNKLLAYLSEAVLVLGAGEKSGALITAKYAKESKKPIFAFPYPPNSASGAGCNGLIKQGGYLVENAEDIAQKLSIEWTEEKTLPAMSAEEERVYTALKESGETHASVLAQTAGIPVFKLRAILSSLEVKSLVVSLGGNTYSAV